MDPRVHRALGLTDDEEATIRSILGREPNHLELAMYAVMWSEHCSYKSSRLHLRRLPTTGERVVVGPGENAGVVDAGGGVGIAVRIESHNHPSAIEPYQGAATGVGGILRDIFTMGARPIAVMDALYFGRWDEPRARWLIEGVVSGISGYGNSVGVPTVGGEVAFDACYAGNPLVNVLCLGVLPLDRLVLGKASGEGNLAVLLGSSTGRDGIGGVSVLASAGFTGGSARTGSAVDGGDGEAHVADGPSSGAVAEGGDDAKRPSVQVGDPFEEKRLIEACLALLDAGLVVGIQDLGGAGLTCATSETAGRAGMGMDVDVDAVARRQAGMEPFEVMTSESQERMLAIVTPQNLDDVLAVCARWEVRADVVGRVTRPVAVPAGGRGAGSTTGGADGADGGSSGPDGAAGRLKIRAGIDGPVLADVPAASLSEAAPLYDRPMRAVPPPAAGGADDPDTVAAPDASAMTRDITQLVRDPAWVYRQYDHQLFLNTVVGPGGDATVLKLAAPGVPWTGGGVVLSVDGNPRWCSLDPRAGTRALVAESALNVACGGGRPVALVNCLNFGNPEHPEVMWQLSESVDGMAEACQALEVPVVGGNVSLYNESAGRDILPTPVVGVVGLADRLSSTPPGVSLVDGGVLLLIDADSSEAPRPSGLGGSRWAVECRGLTGGVLAPVDLDAHRRLLDVVVSLVTDEIAGADGNGGAPANRIAGIHDVSDGGLAVCLAEMALRSGIGMHVRGVAGHASLFGERPSRVVVCARSATAAADIAARANGAGMTVTELGTAGGGRLVVDGPTGGSRAGSGGGLPAHLVDIAVGDLVVSSRAWWPT